MKVGIALGGGGARGFAHIGVLEVLEREKIGIDIISGTSMGALIGSLYAEFKDLSLVKKKIFSYIEEDVVRRLESNFASLERNNPEGGSKLQKPLLFLKEVFFCNVRLFKKYLVDYEPFETLLKGMFGAREFSDCKIPVLCVATDLISQRSVHINKGQLWKAVFASIALPGVFPPVEDEGRLLFDGGVLESVPTESLRKRKTGFVIAVSLEKENIIHDFKNSMDIAYNVDETRHKKLVDMSLSESDFILEPATSEFGWADFSKIEEIIEKGREEADSKVVLLKKKIKYRKIFPFYRLIK